MRYSNVRTAYGPRYYRSKTEARWAAWFDRMQIPFHYEPSKVDLGFCNYVPDFYLPDQNAYFEVKAGNYGPTQIKKIKSLAEVTHCHTYLFGNGRFAEEPNNRQGYGYVWRPDGSLYGDDYFTWCICPICDAVDVALLGKAKNMTCQCIRTTKRTLYADEHVRIARAFKYVAPLFPNPRRTTPPHPRRGTS